jgi:hypothetical protein
MKYCPFRIKSKIRFNATLGAMIVLLLACKQGTETTATVKAEEGDQPTEFAAINFDDLVKVDVLGTPFADTVLSEFSAAKNIGPNNLMLQDDFVQRFAHLAETHAADLESMGFESCFSYDVERKRDVTEYRKYQSGLNSVLPEAIDGAVEHFVMDLMHSLPCFLQVIKLSDQKWRTSRTPPDLQPPLVISLFFPNVMAVYLDTTGTWPFGQRLTDPMPGRFGALFLDMGGDCSGKSDLQAARTARVRAGKTDRTMKDFLTGKKSPGDQSQTSPNASPDDALSPDEKCDLDSLGRPSRGEVANSFKAYGNPNKNAFPLNPSVHTWIDPKDKNRVLIGFEEENFPFLRPPNASGAY